MSSTLLRPLALLCGYDLRTIRRSDSLDLNLRRFFAGRAVGLVVDCGGYRGDFGKMCRWAGYRGNILSFEPGTESYAYLAKSAAQDGSWQARQLALGAEPGRLTLNLNGSGFSSLLPSKTDMLERFPNLTTQGREEVEIVCLDDALDAEGVGDDVAIFLKSDTQGHDLEVLKGARRRLAQVAAIMVETPVQTIYEGAPDYFEITRTLHDLGFAPFAFSTVSRDASGGIIEYDAIWTRQR